MLESEKLNSVIAELPTISEAGVVYRFIKAKYLNEPLSSIGSLKVGGRYNIKDQFEALYLANNPITALREIRAIVETSSEIIASRLPPYVLLSIEYNIVIFTQNLSSKSLLRVYDNTGTIQAQLP
ncbi:MAG: RES domain-containing protein [Waterburya sp.]